ncbi:hypothetical protein NEICINOT_04424 [Neisseria cinerea ATCC 14685]|uniref:Uncharacterized protein n=1 Tax=Neisseria cinerea ATCC 14685 TaxID=546262 RepID=D0W432_NEICI|nr:hypothetical protein NEICINOT_04424 [Neisseria cinerea ATCC 14685]
MKSMRVMSTALLLMPILSAYCKAVCLMKGKMPSEHCSDGIFKWKAI